TFATGGATLSSLSLNGGTLITNGDLTVAGPLVWDGTLQGVDGGGSLTITRDMTFTGGGTGGDLNPINAAAIAWTAGSVPFYGQSSFTNKAGATFTIQTDSTFGSFDNNCIPFYNDGLLRKTAGPGITYLNAVLYNRGTVSIEQGQLALSCGYVQT